MLAAAKERSVDAHAGLLAKLAENSHPGQIQPPPPAISYYGAPSSTSHWAWTPCGYENRGGPRYSGYFRDAETGLDYADQRYHQTGFGRFTTPDPARSGLNHYAYVGGDPVNNTDPSGLFSCSMLEQAPGCTWNDGTPGPVAASIEGGGATLTQQQVVLPPVTLGDEPNCSTDLIYDAAGSGMTIQQYFESDTGILATMSFFEQQGSGTAADRDVWAALNWTFINQWQLPLSDKLWFYGSRANIPTTFAATVTTGLGRSQVFTSSGQLRAGFNTQLINILTGSPDSSSCGGLKAAFEVAQGTVNAANGLTPGPGRPVIPNPVPGALQFGSNGAVPTHHPLVTQTVVTTIRDGRNTWTFFKLTYTPPPPPPRPRRR